MAHKKGAGSTKNGRDSNAKRLGVKTGTRVSVAKEKIQGLIVCEARPKRYVEIHNQILEVFPSIFKRFKYCLLMRWLVKLKKMMILIVR